MVFKSAVEPDNGIMHKRGTKVDAAEGDRDGKCRDEVLLNAFAL